MKDVILLKEKIEKLSKQKNATGSVFQNTYGYVGAEIDLIARGLGLGGILDGPKARLYMQVCLMAGIKIMPPFY